MILQIRDIKLHHFIIQNEEHVSLCTPREKLRNSSCATGCSKTGGRGDRTLRRVVTLPVRLSYCPTPPMCERGNQKRVTVTAEWELWRGRGRSNYFKGKRGRHARWYDVLARAFRFFSHPWGTCLLFGLWQNTLLKLFLCFSPPLPLSVPSINSQIFIWMFLCQKISRLLLTFHII